MANTRTSQQPEVTIEPSCSHGVSVPADSEQSMQSSHASLHRYSHVRPEGESLSYGSVIMHGGSLHQGNNYYLTTMQQPMHTSRLLESLRYPEMNRRATQVVDAFNQTFQWVFDSSLSDSSNARPSISSKSGGFFRNWLQSPEKLFWVSGKPGSGKSTFMKFLASHNETALFLRKASSSQSTIVLRFYFWLHGTEMQRQIRGCLATLLCQLLEEDEQLALDLLNLNKRFASKHSIHDWETAELQQCLLQSLKNMSSSCCIFIDGLDECDQRKEGRDLLDLVDTISGVDNVKLCVSSRHEPIFEQHYLQITKISLQDLTYNDMLKVAQEKLEIELKLSPMSITDVECADLARSVASRAEGVFLWTLTAVNSLMVGLRNYDDISTLHARLSELPAEMKLLYEHMLKRLQGDEQVYAKETSLYFGVSRFLSLPLTIFTMATNERLFQKLMSSNRDNVADILGEFLRECESMKRKVSARTGGLLITRGKTTFQGESKTITAKTKAWEISQPRNMLASSSRYGICACSHRHKNHILPGPLFAQSMELRRNTRNWVSFVHRSVIDFLQSNPIISDSHPRENERESESMFNRLLFTSVFLLFINSKTGDDDAGLWAVIDFLLETASEAHIVSAITNLATRKADRLFHELGHSCVYGWPHEIFGSYILEDLGGYFEFPFPSLDFPGMMACGGYLSFLQKCSECSPSSWSSYYLGYLVECTTQIGFYDDEIEERHIRRCNTLRWLIAHGADLYSPHLGRHRHFGHFNSLLPRSPVLGCWLFAFNMLRYGEKSSCEVLHCCQVLVADLIKQNTDDDVACYWTIGTHDVSDIYVTDERMLQSRYGIRFCLKTSLRTLRQYVMNKIDGFQYDRSRDLIPSIFKLDEALCYCECWGVNESGFVSVVNVMPQNLEDAEMYVSVSKAFTAVITGDPDLEPSIFQLYQNLRMRHVTSSGDNVCSRLAIFHPLFNFPGHDPDDVRVDDHALSLVAPDPLLEVKGKDWYEHGVLREWHERRRRGLFKASEDIMEYERKNDLIPSYETAPSPVSTVQQGTSDQAVGDLNKNDGDEELEPATEKDSFSTAHKRKRTTSTSTDDLERYKRYSE